MVFFDATFRFGALDVGRLMPLDKLVLVSVLVLSYSM